MTVGPESAPPPPAVSVAPSTPAARKSAGMKPRLLLGPILIAALIVLLWTDEFLGQLPAPAFLANLGYHAPYLPPGIIVFVIMALVAILAARELCSLLQDKGIEASKRVTTTAAIAGVLVSCLIPRAWDAQTGALLVSSAAVVLFVFALRFYSRKKTTAGIIAAAGGALLAFVYLGLMFGFILAIRREHSAWVLLWVLLVIKACDTGAYFTGKAIGRHKLIVWLSPGKTWEGLIGGVILSALIACLGLWALRSAGWVHLPPAPGWIFAGLATGLLFGLAGQAGDLTMSLFKRDAGVKDSGRVLPGFGGVLDVLDSPLLVAPLAYWWLRLLLDAPPH